MRPDIPAGRKRDCRALMEFQKRMYICRCFDRNFLTLARFRENCAGVAGRSGQSCNPFNWPQKLHEVRDIIRPDIQHGPCAWKEKEIGIGVPMFHSMAHHMGAPCNNITNSAIIKKCTCLLMRPTKESIGCRPDPKVCTHCQCSKLLPFGEA